MIKSLSLQIGLAILCVFSAHPALAGLKLLEGEHTVVYDIVNPRGVAFIPNYSNESFVQTVEILDEYSKRVTVTATMAPLKSRIQFPVSAQRIPKDLLRYLNPEPDRQSNDPSIMRLAGEITRAQRYTHEAANAVLSWLADNLTFDTTITVPSDAVSALKNKKAYCVGYSNLAVALLRAAGIPARVAHGYLPPGYEWGFSKEYWGVKVNDGGFHAYLEIYYPDTGWVFSDAEHSHNFVDPFHIILRLDGMEMPGAHKGGYLDVDKATFYTIFKEVNKTVMVDELPLPREKRLGRRIDERQHSALVTGKVVDQTGNPVPKGSLVLWRKGRGIPTPFQDGTFAATIEHPDTYRIELRGAGFARSSQELQIEKGSVHHLQFTLKPGGIIKGRVSDGSNRPVRDGDVFYQEGNASFGVPIDQEGTYRIEGLVPGRYKVTVVINAKEESKSVQVEAGKETLADFMVK